SGVLGNDRGSGLTVSAHTAPAHGSVTIATNGGYTYTPANGYSGPDSFTYMALDGNGSTTVQTVRITVTPVGADDAVRG
ncbi:Ig-like domain-containing protein, partial [Rhizobium johnstonii]|uniref:Ig-like domain-containing protein n=1 Tax=Rhizobium johnstonii TaxID=3019933 RepID=UPI003F9C2ACF